TMTPFIFQNQAGPFERSYKHHSSVPTDIIPMKQGPGYIQFLESLAHSLGSLQELVDAAVEAGLLLLDNALAGKVVDAVVKASLDEVGVHLDKLIHLCAA